MPERRVLQGSDGQSPTNQFMRSLVLILLAAAVGGGGYFFWKSRSSAAADSTRPSRPTTATLGERDIRFSVNAAGEISPAEQVSVRPEVNGRVATLPVDVSDAVRQGDVLFTLDDRDLQIERESTEKNVERARLQLDQAERNHQRARDLFDGNLLSRELYEQARTEYELARNSREQSEKQLELIQDRLSKTRVVAPFDCTVLTRPVSVGQAVSGSGGFNSGTEVLTIANLEDLVINAHINQADVSRLKLDQQVEVQVEAVPGLVVTGRVERIAPQATLKNGIKGFASRILLKHADPRVRPGMTASIRIPVASASNVLAAPLAAVFTELNPETQRQERFVFVVTDGGFEKRLVRVGVSDNFFIELTAGVSAGEVVALELPKDRMAALLSAPAVNKLTPDTNTASSRTGPRPPRPGGGV